MKRSEVNGFIREGMDFLGRMKFSLPPFARWTVKDWKGKGPECREIVERQLGWDITDFGSGDYEAVGLFLFTLRNGPTGVSEGQGVKTYTEKIMIVKEGQVTPTHYHGEKMEDIINRGGGNLVMRVWNAGMDDKPAKTKVTVSMDGVRVTAPAGGEIVMRPGESMSVPQRLYHSFWGEKGTGMVMVGEVSRVNDDAVDNHFLDAGGRFPEIIEDEKPLHLVCNDYARYCGHILR